MNTKSDVRWAWFSAVLAAIVSVAVNIGHAAPISWGFVAFAATLPIMIIGAAELMVRQLLPWPIVAVIGVSAYALSFWHTILILRSWGEPLPLQVLGSVAVDGLMVGATIALYRLRRDNHGTSQVTAIVQDSTPQTTEVRPELESVLAELESAPVERENGSRSRSRSHSHSRERESENGAENNDLLELMLTLWSPDKPLTKDVVSTVSNLTGKGASTIRRQATNYRNSLNSN